MVTFEDGSYEAQIIALATEIAGSHQNVLRLAQDLAERKANHLRLCAKMESMMRERLQAEVWTDYNGPEPKAEEKPQLDAGHQAIVDAVTVIWSTITQHEPRTVNEAYTTASVTHPFRERLALLNISAMKFLEITKDLHRSGYLRCTIDGAYRLNRSEEKL